MFVNYILINNYFAYKSIINWIDYIILFIWYIILNELIKKKRRVFKIIIYLTYNSDILINSKLWPRSDNQWYNRNKLYKEWEVQKEDNDEKHGYSLLIVW